MESKDDKTILDALLAEGLGTDAAGDGAGDAAQPVEPTVADKPGRKFTRRRFVLGAAVAGGVVAIGTAGTAGTLLLYGQSEGTSGVEEAPASDAASGNAPATVKLPGATTPATAGTEATDKEDVAGRGEPAGESAAGDAEAGAAGDGGTSGGATGGGNDAAAKKWHEGWNEWVVDEPGHWETTTVHREAVYDEVPVYGTICNDCGANISGKAVAHLEETGHHSYRTGQVGTERVVIEPAKDEQIQTWIDEKGHSVWHDGYWE